MPATRQPTDKPATFVVAKLDSAAQLTTRVGRPRKLKMPPLPQDILDGMTPLEREHYEFFVEAIQRDYGISQPSDLIALQQAAIEYVNLLRVQADQLKTGRVISMARQHPGVQLRQWLDMLSTTRKARQGNKPAPEDDPRQKQLVAMLTELSAPAA